jgi:hypothetical protein
MVSAIKDELFLLRPGFEEDGTRYFCPYSAQLTGLFTYYPELRDTVEVIALDFPRPRRPLSDLLGEAHQSPPILVLAGEPALVSGVHVAQARERFFVAKTAEILRYLAVTRGLPLPH